jgi:FtsK/SpoIIIE family
VSWLHGHPHDRYRQPVGWGAWTETPPVITAPMVRERPTDWLFLAVVRPAWAYRVELGLIWLLAVAYYWISWHLSGRAAEAIILAGAIIVAAVPWTREHLAHLLYRSHLRRRWTLACRHAELATRNDRVPRITRCQLTRAGELLRVRVPAGAQVPDLETAAERVAAFLDAREVRVTREAQSARYAKVVVVRCDPLADPKPIPWPLLDARSCSLWQPVPVGLNEDGTQVTIALPYRNLLLGGEPDAGKSSILQLLVAVGALDPAVRLTLLDPKLVELAAWQGCATRLVGPNVDEAIEVLRGLLVELDDRYLSLLANRARKVTADDGLPLHLLGVEELALYTNGPNRKASTEFATLLRDYVARGRAAGMPTVATTQKPSADVVPTYLRDLFGFRWALRCSTPDASDTILGRGWASQGYSATSIDPATRGVGYLLQEGGVPVRLRACYLDDLDLAAIARRAEALRGLPAPSRPTLRIVEGSA